MKAVRQRQTYTMAATYRIVVSTTNCYNSVVIDRRFQHTVHYCNGPCQVLKHGVECTVAHCSTCSELLDTTAEPATGGRPFSTQDLGNTFSAVENGTAVPGATGEDYHQIMQGAPRVKKGLTIQSSTSLKDITGDAINLASGKIKEFSFEKIKYSTSHVTFRKGRKVRPESFSRRSTDLDIIYGHFSSDENCPPFGFVQNSMMEEHKLSRSNSLEQNINNIPILYLNSLTEDNLIAKILEKAKADSSASGEDIKACLDILVKCSEDLKKCTDIIKQCIKNKSMGGDSDDSFTNPEVIYRSVMARLSSYLKKLPFDFEHGQHGRSEHSDLAELVNSLHGLQQTPFSPIFGNEQPPRYEDVVHSPPLIKTLPLSSPLEPQQIPQDSANNVKSVQSFANLQCNTITPNSVHKNSTAVNSSSALPQAVTINRSDSYSSTNSLLSSSSDNICKESMVTLYIEEEHDVGKVLDKELRGEGEFSQGFMEVRQLPKKPIALMETADSTAKLSGNIRNGTIFKPNLEPFALPGASKPYASLKNQEAFQEPGQSNDQDDIDKLLMDLECLSQKIELEPCLNGKSAELKNCSQQAGLHQHLSFDSGSSQPPVDSLTPFSSKKNKSRHGYTTNEEEDGALLLRILESIENFAQELVESGTGKGRLSREGEVMRLLQETVANTGKSEQNLQTSSIPAAIRDTGPTLSIQQTPEVIKVQIKQDKKPGTPPPAPAVSAPSPRTPTPPPVNKVVITAPISINIPRFYFPKGLPNPTANLDETIAKIEAAFAELEEEKADIYEMGKIAKACNCPLYWKAPMFNAAGGERTGFVSVHAFIAMWRKLLHSCYDDASKFVYLLVRPGCAYLEQEDFIPLLQDIVDTHPGLTFLKDAPEFHSRYITTVIQRIFYTVNRSWSGKITMTELRRSNFLQTLALLEEEDDINQITDYFSYEHFYVIYCKFWELDTDHDLFVDQKDLARYNEHASSNRITERIFSGAVTRGNSVQKEGRMSYADFVWFLISEEDKKNPTSIEYWFKCMDLDGDGVLSMYEMEYFYEEQCERMEGMGIEPLPFHDLLCQMLDLVKCTDQGKITLRDLKHCRMAHVFYDTFFNLEKYLDHEQRDPFAVQKDVENDGPEPSDWDKYAAEEYEILVAEETANEQLQEGSFEDDYESDELTVASEIGNKKDKLVISDLSA
ncbi:serine/threonine-protein phosphatase 2A regulatory subunit B'' subunit alpha isoform X1 [Acipenser oxyrinchus oxyrinchus]|uniref:Serine/threonine-protein phosphatase 2A regulatory subunit B'' subunit alpha isoform X1 n=1 Tax=Acipenser oxyrinchus oxyrinchus TaxID=40147 RepID=A0AAD8D5H0_ACIOX|nr:serine/threonine-protein phosphatase 2A regulatory subunit B'' subunit alpha isoform X1 [Acipenser oxyrinchus oxyrinchus]